jgi:hypothetical protein
MRFRQTQVCTIALVTYNFSAKRHISANLAIIRLLAQSIMWLLQWPIFASVLLCLDEIFELSTLLILVLCLLLGVLLKCVWDLQNSSSRLKSIYLRTFFFKVIYETLYWNDVLRFVQLAYELPTRKHNTKISKADDSKIAHASAPKI